ncbi:hypothetical protein ACET3Z_017349 [Daucus carota]
METTGKIIRSSIYIFLSNYHYFTISAILALPFSASVLLSQALIPSSTLLPPIQIRLQALLNAAGLPSSSEIFNIFSLKLSQTITSTVLVLPFTFSFLILAKASVIKALSQQKPSQIKIFSFISILNPIFSTQIWTSLLILSANATSFSILTIAYNFLDLYKLLSTSTSIVLFSAAAALLYSIILANAFVISNLALVLSGMETKGGYISLLKACVLIKGRNSKAISLALPLNLALAAIEALFQYRAVAVLSSNGFPNFSMTLECIVIAYLYSIFIVLDTIISCMFFKSCKTAFFGRRSEQILSLH